MYTFEQNTYRQYNMEPKFSNLVSMLVHYLKFQSPVLHYEQRKMKGGMRKGGKSRLASPGLILLCGCDELMR